MVEGWSRSEVDATVADYFSMLAAELRGEAYNKAAHRRALVTTLNGRSEQAIEFKHCNISAVLNELGFPAIDGYKPRGNYQQLLAEVVAERLQLSEPLVRTVADQVESPLEVPDIEDILRALVDPPAAEDRPRTGRERRAVPYDKPLSRPPVNYLAREANNRGLGLAGELFAVRFEQARLIQAKQEALAARVEHIAVTEGDGRGYDILSFEADGRERLIEVKTTRYARETPFFVTRNEVAVSAAEHDRYHLYRCFGFRRRPRLFTLQGALPTTCVLEPVTYQASVA